MKMLKIVVKRELRENENIFILKESEINSLKGIMKEININEIYNFYTGKEKVKKHWQEDGLCIILKG